MSAPLPTLDSVSLIVHLPEELSSRVEALAAARHQSPEQVAVEAIEAQLPARRRLSFSGVGSSRPDSGDIGRRHREIIAEHCGDRTARDV
jgi:predicted transcriptional regulator